jgi:hypothetical protein
MLSYISYSIQYLTVQLYTKTEIALVKLNRVFLNKFGVTTMYLDIKTYRALSLGVCWR